MASRCGVSRTPVCWSAAWAPGLTTTKGSCRSGLWRGVRYLAVAPAAALSRPWIKRATPAAALGSLLFPAGIFAWLLAHPVADPNIVVPWHHFVIVTAVSALAFGPA